MKVLYIIDSLQTGGAEKSLLEISSRLKRCQPIVCCVYSGKSDFKKEFELRGIPLLELRVTSKFWWLDGARKFKRLVKEIKPDLVHATLYKSEIIARLSLLNSSIPHVGSFVNDSYSVNRYSHQPFLRNVKLEMVRFIDRITARSVPYFMSITRAIAASNSKALGVKVEKITCIYRGRSIDEFVVSHPRSDQKPFTFLTVARLLKRKGYTELLKAARILKEKGYGFLIRIAGDGPDYPIFLAMVREFGIEKEVEFLMTQKDIPSLLANSHCFVFPSHYEGQGGALVEAMLAAKPIIASDIDVFREQLTPNKTAVLFKVFNSEDLSDKMEWMMDNYQQGIMMGLEARSFAVERFDIENTALEHETMYMKIVNKRRVNSI